jgi:methyl-accepting chemotaxis protein
MVATRNRFFVLLAWLQLFVSLAFAAALAWGYMTYQSSLGQIVQSIATSIGAVSSAVARTAETVESRRELLNQSAQLLAETRKLVNALVVTTENQAKRVPQTAAGLQSAASVTAKLGVVLHKVGDRMMTLSVPTGIRMEGLKPVPVMTRPLEEQAKEAIATALDIKAISESFSSLATTIGSDGQSLSTAVVNTGNQALKVIAEADNALGRLNGQDLPKAIDDLNAVSKNLSVVGTQVELLSTGCVFLLAVGLILAAWCFLNSLGFLMLVIGSRPATNQPITE